MFRLVCRRCTRDSSWQDWPAPTPALPAPDQLGQQLWLHWKVVNCERWLCFFRRINKQQHHKSVIDTLFQYISRRDVWGSCNQFTLCNKKSCLAIISKHNSSMYVKQDIINIIIMKKLWTCVLHHRLCDVTLRWCSVCVCIWKAHTCSPRSGSSGCQGWSEPRLSRCWSSSHSWGPFYTPRWTNTWQVELCSTRNSSIQWRESLKQLHSHCHVAGLALREVLLWSDQHRLGEESAVPLPEGLDVLLVIEHLRKGTRVQTL